MKKIYLMISLLSVFLLFSAGLYAQVTVKNPIKPLTVLKNSYPTKIDLTNVFVLNGSAPVTSWKVLKNSNSLLVNPYLEGNFLVLEYSPDLTGQSLITISGTGGGSSANTEFNLNVFDDINPPVSFEYNMTSQCAPFDLNFTNTSIFGQTGVIYKWSIFDGTKTISSSNFNYTFLRIAAGIYTVKLIAFNNYGEWLSEFEQDIVINGRFSSFKTTANSGACPGEKVFFFVDREFYSLKWLFPDGDEADYNYASSTFLKEGTYKVRMAIETQCGIDTVEQNVTISSLAKPIVDIAPAETDFCPNDKIHFDAITLGPLVSWNFGDGSTSNEFKPEHAFAKAGTYRITLTATNLCKNSASKTVSLNIKEGIPASAGFSFWPDYGQCPNQPVYFEAYSEGFYIWDFGDGGSSKLKSTENLFTDTGSYTVTLTNINGCGSSASESRLVKIGYNPDKVPQVFIGFKYNMGVENTYFISPGESVHFSNESFDPDGISYIWNFGDGSTSTERAPIHKFTKEGTFTVTLTATNDCKGTNKESLTVVVSAKTQPEAYLKVKPEQICPGEKVYFYDEFENNILLQRYTYNIDFGDGTSAKNLTNFASDRPRVLVSHIYSKEGQYPYVFEAVTKSGIKQTISGTVIVSASGQNPSDFYVRNSTQSYSGNIEFWKYNLAVAFGSYSLMFNYDSKEYEIKTKTLNGENIISQGTFSRTGTNITFFDNGVGCNGIEGTYSYSFTNGILNFKIIDDNCRERQTILTAGGFNFTDQLEAYLYENSTCPGDTVDFSVAGGIKYAWTFKDGLTSGVQFPAKVYPNIGVYRELVKITDACNRTEEMPSIVRISRIKKPGAWFYYDQSKTFANQNVAFFSSYYEQPNDKNKYYWDFGDGSNTTERDPMHKFINAGKYEVKLYVKNGCGEDIYKEEVFIKGSTFRAKFNQTISGLKVIFNDASYGNPSSWYWTFGDGFTSTIQNPTHTYSKEGLYNVCLSIKNPATGVVENVCIDIPVGIVTCDAKYNYYQNELTNTAYFKDISVGKITNWAWDFGDGSYSTEQNPKHTYIEKGSYDVCLTAFNNSNNCVSTQCQYIHLGGESQIYFSDFSFLIDPATSKVSFNDKSSPSTSDWYWDFGDGNFSTEKDPTYTYPKTGEYEVCLYVNDSSFTNYESRCKSIYIKSTSTQGLFADFDFYIDQKTNFTKFNNKSTGAYTEILWDFGDGKYSAEANTNHTYLKSNTYVVCLSLYNSTTNTFSDICKELVIEGEATAPEANFIAVIDTLTKSVMFRDKSIGNITDWYWEFGDGASSSEKNPKSHTYDKPDVYNVCLYVYDSNSDTYSEKCKDVLIKDKSSVVLNARFSYMMNPSANEIKFNDKSIGQINEWYWDFGDGDYSSLQSPVHKYNKAGKYKVCLTIYNSASDVQSEQCEEIELRQSGLVADFIPFFDQKTDSVICTDISKGRVHSWSWDFGDGWFSNLQNPKYKYWDAGVYNVCLTVMDTVSGVYSKACKELKVRKLGDLLTLKADYSYFIDPATNEVVFENKSTGKITNYYWTLGDGAYKTDENVKYTYKNPGVYEVCLFVLNSNNGSFDQVCKQLKVSNKDCKIGAAFTYFMAKKNNKVIFADESWGKIAGRFWTFGDGESSFGRDTIGHIYKEPGVYDVTLFVNDATGKCSDISKQSVNVGNIDCFAKFNYITDPKSKKVIFDNRSRGTNIDYYWSFGDGEFSTSENPGHTYDKPGKYLVGLTISNNKRNCYDSYEEEIQIGQIECSAKFSYFIDASNKTAQFQNKAIGQATNVYWQFGDGGTSTEKDPKHTYSTTGYFTVSLSTFNESTACMDYYEEVILVGERGKDCMANFIYQIDGRTVKFFDKSTGKIVKYIWDFNNGTTSKARDTVVVFDKSGFYNICLSIIDETGVQNTTCRKIEIRDPGANNCKTDFIFTSDIATRTASFVDKSLGKPDKWNWDFGDGSTSTEQNPKHTYGTANYYKVRLVTTNSTTGCSSRIIYIINVSNSTKLYAGFDIITNPSTFKSGGYPTDFMSSSFGTPAKAVWDFGDGSKDSTSTTPSHVYQSVGNYQVCLTVSDPNTGQKSEPTCQTIKVGEPISVTGPIEDLSVSEDAVPTVLDISKVFAGSTNIIISLSGNSNTDIVSASINGTKLTLTYSSEKSGKSIIKLKGVSDTQELTDEFQVEVKAVDDPPYVKNSIPDVTVKKNAVPASIDLSNIFDDIDNDPAQITKTIQSVSNINLLSATVDGNNLKISFQPDQFGEAKVIVRATSNNIVVDEEFLVTVNNVVGISDISLVKEINIYPNPTQGIFSLEILTRQFADVLIEIVSAQGQILYNSKIEKMMRYKNLFDLREFRSGIYYIRVTIGEQTIVKEIVIQN